MVRRVYMVFAEAPPEGYTEEAELLVSLTIADVKEAWSDYVDSYNSPSVWEELSASHRKLILAAVQDSGLDLFQIFNGLYYKIVGQTVGQEDKR